MQIDGARAFFSRISALTTPQGKVGGAQNNPLSAILSPLQRITSDTVTLSNTGNAANSSENVTDTLKRTLTRAKAIFERMHELATIAAQNEDLTDLDRVEMQIEFEELRIDLSVVFINMASGSRISRQQHIHLMTNGSSTFFRHEDFGDGSNVLERMRTRILNGQEWNVREAYTPGFIMRDGSGKTFSRGWHVIDDKNKNILTMEDGRPVETGRIVPTTREVLESRTPVILMDAISAADGANRLENQINSVQSKLDRIASDNCGGFYETFDFLIDNPFRGGTLLFPSAAEFFMTGFADGRVWNSPFFFLEPPERGEREIIYARPDGKPLCVLDIKVALAKMEPKILNENEVVSRNEN